MHDDIVCVEMFPEERWVAPSSLVLHDEGVAGDVAEENEEDVLKAESGKMRRPTGKVIGIIKRNSRLLCGMLIPSPIKEATRHLFTPADRHMPRVRVETRQAASLQAHRIVVAIDGWLRHSRYPNVRLHRDAPHAVTPHPSVPWSASSGSSFCHLTRGHAALYAIQPSNPKHER
ncbi:exosome complex exonuclease RRP44-like [Petromyzon marinus]|uniref:exosome complex exonuclease RRP44-like n=1 Tax=Petromyzon marinus TaxID=7757 RepID=UPI003F725EC6